MIWIKCAKEVLRNNKVNAYVFAAAIRDLLEKGRGKNRNIMIVGPANYGKTFVLNPRNQLFQTFTNPATTSYAWVGSENAEVIFLNDFRWSPEILAWNDMLLLEGQTLHLLAPKTHFAKDIVFDRDTPIFATSKGLIVFVDKGGEGNRNDVRKMETLFLFLSNSREFTKGKSFLQTVLF
jgi:hypothetical protein